MNDVNFERVDQLNHSFNLCNRGGYFGQLGYTCKKCFNYTPKRVDELDSQIIVDVACGRTTTTVIDSTGAIYTFGCNCKNGNTTGHGIFPQTVTTPTILADLSTKKVNAVSSALHHSACITAAGEVYTWGHGKYGKLGHGDETNCCTPKLVEALDGMKAILVSCGYKHTVVCTEDQGAVYTFGRGEEGQLGHGDNDATSTPRKVQALQDMHIIEVKCGGAMTMALTVTGYLYTWGSDTHGKYEGNLGHGTACMILTIPCLVEALREHNVVQISAGYFHCAAMVSPHPNTIRTSQQEVLVKKEDSNFVFMVRNEPICAHIGILSKKSEYFRAMFRSNMRESVERVVKVQDCSKSIFKFLLEYIYLGTFPSIDHIVDAVELYRIADIYQVEGLMFLCKGFLEKLLMGVGAGTEEMTGLWEKLEGMIGCDALKNHLLARKSKGDCV